MFDSRAPLRFAGRFLLIFVLLTLPWPGFRESYCRLIRSEAHWLLTTTLKNVIVIIEDNDDPQHPSVDTRITLGNRRDIRADGTGPVRVIVIDSRSLGWMPNAMFIALMGALASRTWFWLRGFFTGLLLVNVFIAATLWITVAHGYFEASAAARLQICLGYANRLLVTNLWVSFVFPTMIWLGCLRMVWEGGMLRGWFSGSPSR